MILINIHTHIIKLVKYPFLKLSFTAHNGVVPGSSPGGPTNNLIYFYSMLIVKT